MWPSVTKRRGSIGGCLLADSKRKPNWLVRKSGNVTFKGKLVSAPLTTQLPVPSHKDQLQVERSTSHWGLLFLFFLPLPLL